MKKSEDKIDVSSLPEHAKIELFDFYEFLSKKYGRPEQEEKSRNARGGMKKFLSEPISVEKIVTFSREELHERR